MKILRISQALTNGPRPPLISNTDQGSQFTSPGYIDAVELAGVEVSMDGVGRWMDNRFIERLWWSTKYEDVYINDYGDGLSAGRGLTQWFNRHNTERPHQSLDDATPAEWYFSPESYGGQPATWEAMRTPRTPSALLAGPPSSLQTRRSSTSSERACEQTALGGKKRNAIKTEREGDGPLVRCSSLMNRKQLLLCAAVAGLLSGCRNPSPTHSSGGNGHGGPSPIHASQTVAVDPLDKRNPVPLLPRMAAHQRENMRDHLAAIQEIIAAVSAGDFAGVERSAGRIGYSEQMGQMCTHMGAGAPGFTELALNFHRTADTITTAAKRQDTAATLKAVSATLQTCVGCHAVYRQQIVDEPTWKAITGRPAPAPARQ